MPMIFGVNFLGVGPETLEKQGRNICRQHSLEKFDGDFPKLAGLNSKIHPKSALGSTSTE